jgi:lipoprotein-releasing system permease protein
MRTWELFLALRYVRPKKRRGFINLITMISLAGVSISVMGLIVVISVMNGFDKDIRDRIIGTNAHVVVNAYGKGGMREYEPMMEGIRRMPHVVAASAYFQGQAMLKSDAGVFGGIIQGIIPEEHTKVASLKQALKEGDLRSLNPQEASGDSLVARTIPVLLGKELADNLNTGVGQELTLLSPVFRMTPFGLLPKIAKLKVAGIFQTGFYEYDAGLAYIPLSDAQRLFDAPGAVTQVGIKVDDLDHAASVADELQAKDQGIRYWARDWLRMHRNLFTALETEKKIMFIILACMVMVAAFNIASTLIMVVMEKQKEIGILKSLGATRMALVRLFMIQGLMIGFSGTALGFAMGTGICAFLKAHPMKIPGGGSVYYIEFLPVSVERLDLIVILFVSLAICLMASLYPAFMAARQDPVEAIRYE